MHSRFVFEARQEFPAQPCWPPAGVLSFLHAGLMVPLVLKRLSLSSASLPEPPCPPGIPTVPQDPSGQIPAQAKPCSPEVQVLLASLGMANCHLMVAAARAAFTFTSSTSSSFSGSGGSSRAPPLVGLLSTRVKKCHQCTPGLSCSACARAPALRADRVVKSPQDRERLQPRRFLQMSKKGFVCLTRRVVVADSRHAVTRTPSFSLN